MEEEIKKVVISMHNGCIEVDILPKGVELTIKDYDIDGSEDRCKVDKDGEKYQESVFDSWE